MYFCSFCSFFWCKYVYFKIMMSIKIHNLQIYIYKQSRMIYTNFISSIYSFLMYYTVFFNSKKTSHNIFPKKSNFFFSLLFSLSFYKSDHYALNPFFQKFGAQNLFLFSIFGHLFLSNFKKSHNSYGNFLKIALLGIFTKKRK